MRDSIRMVIDEAAITQSTGFFDVIAAAEGILPAGFRRGSLHSVPRTSPLSRWRRGTNLQFVTLLLLVSIITVIAY